MRVLDGSKSSIISIHALLAESDWPGLLARPFFLISIHALLAESDCLWVLMGGSNYISIHALLAESDIGTFRTVSVKKTFLSTLSLRRATFSCFWCILYLYISIHALLAESDAIQHAQIHKLNDFYPRSPCGERPPRVIRQPTTRRFLSTLSLRRATPIH